MHKKYILVRKNKKAEKIYSLYNSSLPIQLEFIGKDFQLCINQTEESAYKLENNKVSKIQFKNKFVSDTTTKIVSDILHKNDCELPTLEFLSHLHYELFRIFNNHIYKITKQKLQKCPIT